MNRPAPIDIGEYKHGFSFPDQSVFKTRKGLDEEVVRAISAHKGEPDWMQQYRLRALKAGCGREQSHLGSRRFACQATLSGGTTLPVALHAHRCHCPGVDAVAHTLGESTPRTPGLRSVWSVTVFGRLWTRKAILEPLSVTGRIQRMPLPWTRALLSVSNRELH